MENTSSGTMKFSFVWSKQKAKLFLCQHAPSLYSLVWRAMENILLSINDKKSKQGNLNGLWSYYINKKHKLIMIKTLCNIQKKRWCGTTQRKMSKIEIERERERWEKNYSKCFDYKTENKLCKESNQTANRSNHVIIICILDSQKTEVNKFMFWVVQEKHRIKLREEERL